MKIKRGGHRQISEVQGAFGHGCQHWAVLAMQGGFDYDHSVFNRATQADRQLGPKL